MPDATPTSNAFTINLPSIATYNTYSISFLYFGLDQAIILAQQAAVADQAVGSNYTFPCFPIGYTGAAAYSSSITVCVWLLKQQFLQQFFFYNFFQCVVFIIILTLIAYWYK